jgi:hypothetical protein
MGSITTNKIFTHTKSHEFQGINRFDYSVHGKTKIKEKEFEAFKVIEGKNK